MCLLTLPFYQSEPLNDGELARLGAKLSSMAMRSIAIQRLGFTEDQVSTTIDECKENKEAFKRQLLVKWRNRSTKHTRQVSIALTGMNMVTAQKLSSKSWRKQGLIEVRHNHSKHFVF